MNRPRCRAFLPHATRSPNLPLPPQLPRTSFLSLLPLLLLAPLGSATAAAEAATAPAEGVHRDEIRIMGNAAGSQAVTTHGDTVRAEFSFNDRGRGDHIVATWKLDAAGVPVQYQGDGNDYMKVNVTETFQLAGGRATWRNRSEQATTTVSGEAFYVPMNPPPEIWGVLTRALLKATQHRLALLPVGEATLEEIGPLPPPIMPVIAAEAHARGLRVSGHVPAFMSAQEFVEGGADEIQHLNFIVLDFLFDTVKETRNMNRFTAVAEHARDLGPDKPEVREFITYLARHHTVLDPTMNVFEAMFCGNPAALTPGLEGIAARLPAQVRRGLLSGALTVPKGEEAQYREAFPAMLRLLKALYDAGVTIIPGTDSIPGYELHHELEIYVRAGIAPAEVLRMATITSATVIGVDGERGVIAPGKLADLILVNGDPSREITDIDKVDVVMKGGKLYDPARVEGALGMSPRTPPPPGTS